MLKKLNETIKILFNSERNLKDNESEYLKLMPLKKSKNLSFKE